MNNCKPVLWTLAVLAALGGLVGAALVFGGAYNISATAQHLQPTYSLLEATMRSSVQRRASGIAVPPSLEAPERVRQGAACYRASCVQCHGGPGVAAHTIGLAMQPVPGTLIAAAKAWQARELYWITRHGIKMSGMPAWQFHLSEADLWSVVAFVQRLPDLTPAAYGELMAQTEGLQCRAPAESAPPTLPADRARIGQLALRQYACHGCHSIPGIVGAQPQVGPPLTGFASRQMIAGRLANTHANLVAWIRHPQQIDPLTAMPDLGVTEAHAEAMAAYLKTLR